MTEPTPEQTEAVTQAIRRVHLSLQLAALEVLKTENNPLTRSAFDWPTLRARRLREAARSGLSRQLTDRLSCPQVYVDLYSKALGLGNDGP